jgi:hypothetical protein
MHQVIAGVIGFKRKILQRQPAQAVVDGFHDVLKAGDRVQAGEQKLVLAPGGERDFRQAVLGAREVLGALEFGHGVKAPVQPETPPVVAAAQKSIPDAAGFGHDHAAVRANVAEDVQVIVEVPGDQQGFVQATFQERLGLHRTGRFEVVGIAHELPASREDALPGQFKKRGILVERGGQRAGFLDAVRDEQFLWHDGSPFQANSRVMARMLEVLSRVEAVRQQVQVPERVTAGLMIFDVFHALHLSSVHHTGARYRSPSARQHRPGRCFLSFEKAFLDGAL